MGVYVKTLKEKAFPLCAFVWRTPVSMSVRTDLKFKFQAVSKFEVERNLKSIKRSKATGLDDLPPGLLKDSAELIAAPLTHLVNLSLATNIFPADWKNAKIIPVYKSGTHSNLDNYRPISILPVLSKIIEKIVHRQLMSFLDKILFCLSFSLASVVACRLSLQQPYYWMIYVEKLIRGN